MDKAVYTYALIKSLYEQGEDYLDSFWPFVLKVIPSNDYFDYADIQTFLLSEFELKIPLHVLRTTITRIKAKKFIEQKRGERSYRKTREGNLYTEQMETDRAVERRINALIVDISSYFKKKNIILNNEDIQNALLSFVHRNIESLIEFINPSSKEEFPHFDAHEELLFDYISSAENEKPEMYHTLEEIVYGSLISVVLYAEKSSIISTLEKDKFAKCTLYVDTNLIFSLLGLHGDIFIKPAKELFHLLRKFNFDFKIFSFTLDEICRVLVSFGSKAHIYIDGLDIDSIYSYMKKEGWTQTKAKEYVAQIEQNLSNLGFAVEWVEEVNITDEHPETIKLRKEMEKYKPDQNEKSQNHDLLALIEVSKRRSRKIRNIEEASELFLTADAKLARFNFEKMEHKQNGTISEVILDRLLMNILWLKNPNLEIPLETLIAAHSRDLFINRRVWERFCKILQDLKRKGKTDVDHISMLFYNRYIEDTLRNIDESEVNQIDEIFVLEKIEEASTLPKKELEEAVTKTKKGYMQLLKEEVSKVEKEKEEEWACKIQTFRKKMRENAQRNARIYTWVMRITFSLLLLIPTIVLLGLGRFDIIERAENIVSLTLIALSAALNVFQSLWQKIEKSITEKIYNKQVRNLDSSLNDKELNRNDS